MTTRHFPTDAELDAIVENLPDPATLPVAALDQYGAASRDMARMGHAFALASLAHGGWAFLGTPPDDIALRRRMIRPRLKMLLAAFAEGVTDLCEHTRQIRPVLLMCDPPALVCMQPACRAKVDQLAQTEGFRWDHQCDACGRRVEMLTPHLLALGPLTISGHLCAPCSRDTATAALDAAADIQPVSRKTPCPCGSGRRFKRCHGNQRAAA